MAARMVAHVRGLVQRAGFRDFVQQQAYRRRVKGTVENRPDGSVRIVAEAPEPALREFVASLREASPPIEIEAIETSKEAATGEFADFTVLWSGNEGILEKLDVGFRYVKEMNHDLGAKTDAVGTKVEAVGTKVDELGAKVDSVGAKVDGVGTRVEAVGAKVDDLGTRIDAVGAKVDNLGTKVEAVGKEVASVGAKVDSVGQEVRGVGAKVDSVGHDVRGVGEKVDAARVEIQTLGGRVGDLTLQTAGHFERLDRNYGKISQALEAALRELQAGRTESAAALRELRDEHRASRKDMQELIGAVVASGRRR